MSFLVSPACPLYFPDVEGLKYGNQPQKTSYYQQFWECSDIIKFQIYWPGNVPAAVFCDLVDLDGATTAFSPVSLTDNVHYFEVDLSTTGLCEDTIYLQIRWDDGQIRAIRTADMLLRSAECIDNTMIITYSSPKKFVLNGVPVLPLDHTVRLRSYLEYYRTVNDFTQSQGFTGVHNNIYGTATTLFKFTIPHFQGHVFFHNLAAAIFQFNSIKISKPGQPTGIASPDFLEFIKDQDYTFNINDPLSSDIWTYPGEGVLRLKADQSHITNC